MSWNYRVIKHVADGEEFYQIHEVYYNDENNPASITEEGIVPFGETTEELSHTLIHMMSALTKPVLNATMFTNDPEPNKTIDKTLGMLRNV